MKNLINSWVKEYRSLIEWEWFTDVATAHLWEYIRLKANYEDKKWRGIEIKKGSFVTSLAHMSVETGLSIQQVRTALKRLNSTHEITSQSTHDYTIITVNKWREYQPNDDISTYEQHISNTLATTTKEIKNIRNKEYINNKPTLDDVKKYCDERKNDIDPQAFIDYYESVGWKIGNKPMKDFKACIRTWERRHKTNKQKDELPTYTKDHNQEMSESDADELLKLMGKK